MNGAQGIENKSIQRDLRFIAWHHFHPKIIEKYAFNIKTKQYSFNNIKVVPTVFVKSIIQYDSMCNGYTKSDEHTNGEGYYFVPSYTIVMARTDLDQARKNMESQQTINNVLTANITREHQSNNANDSSEIQQYKDRIASLENAVRMSDETAKKNERMIILDVPQESNLLLSGINRFTIQSDTYHRDNPLACKDFSDLTRGSFVKVSYKGFLVLNMCHPQWKL